MFKGLTIFRGIQALDRDKPNTANSEIVYTIVSGNSDRKFSIEATSKKAVLVLRKSLDYDSGERVFNISIKAQVSKENKTSFRSKLAQNNLSMIHCGQTG